MLMARRPNTSAGAFTGTTRDDQLAYTPSRWGATYAERKEARRIHFEQNVKGWKLRPCLACNGSGHYDHNGSPKCGACNGTGKGRYKPSGAP